jgi:hypothetical protein
MAVTGDHTIADLAELSTVSRATVYRPSNEPRPQIGPGNQPEPLPCTPGTPHRTADRPLADHRYLAVILNVVFALGGAVSPLVRMSAGRWTGDRVATLQTRGKPMLGRR